MKQYKGDWLAIAKALPLGGQARTICTDGCGSDASQLVSHNDRGYSRYCFRCKENEFESHGLRSISLIDQARMSRAITDLNDLKLPDDFTTDVPAHAALWYYRFGISAELARSYGIGYSPSLNRVVMPVYENGELVTMQMRAVPRDMQPKYLNPSGKNMQRCLFESGVSSGLTVITEDILSAIKVGRVVHATSILGTNMSDVRALKIAENNHTALVWLDGDKAGIDGALHARNQLLMQNVEVHVVRTTKDPKAYSLDDIRRIIQDI